MDRILADGWLVAHSLSFGGLSRSVRATVRHGSDNVWSFQFEASEAEAIDIPDRVSPARADDLWKHTCFEVFIRPIGSDAYFEFNFSPSTRWAAYAFDSYRKGMRHAKLRTEPQIAVVRGQSLALAAGIDIGDMPELPWAIGISAVIKDTEGGISYWALAHPSSGPPDFHDPACFVLELPPLPQ